MAYCYCAYDVFSVTIVICCAIMFPFYLLSTCQTHSRKIITCRSSHLHHVMYLPPTFTVNTAHINIITFLTWGLENICPETKGNTLGFLDHQYNYILLSISLLYPSHLDIQASISIPHIVVAVISSGSSLLLLNWILSLWNWLQIDFYWFNVILFPPATQGLMGRRVEVQRLFWWNASHIVVWQS